ncbi:hypothetical protein DSO57_1006024 [Entomophthora muscae]|uniref:Uncharacterized protein n=1 Tax=Entomophthora muscae TaxID=34485 RepID=A0ACC2T7H1_9FUNG|nr:hypothetical protein DSO57_1006024 [Entomophthora muscae]
MTPPLTLRPDQPLEPTATAETTSTQLFGVLYITLKGSVDSVVPNSGPWSLLGRSLYYIIKLAPILWWALPAGLTTPHPEPPNASAYDWCPDKYIHILCNCSVLCSIWGEPTHQNFACKHNHHSKLQELLMSEAEFDIIKLGLFCFTPTYEYKILLGVHY